MNTRIFLISITLFVLVVFLSGCGATSPTGTSGFGSTATRINGITGVSFSAVFPTPPPVVNGLNPLISASTATIDIWIRDSVGNTLNFATVTSASPTAMIPVTGYTGPVKIYITSYDATWTSTGWHIQDASIYPGMTTPISIALAEFDQGAAAVTGTLTAPDATVYALKKVFLLRGGPSLIDYQLGIDVGLAAPSYHLSSQNLDITTPNGIDPPNISLYVVNDKITLPVDVPNATRTIWNRYDITLNFMNAVDQFGNPIPTNTPTITGTFMGTYTYVGGIVVPATGTVPGPIGTLVVNVPNATWTNNVAPPVVTPIAF